MLFLLRAGHEIPDPVPFKETRLPCYKVLYSAQGENDKYAQLVTKDNVFYLTNYEKLDILGAEIRKQCKK